MNRTEKINSVLRHIKENTKKYPNKKLEVADILKLLEGYGLTNQQLHTKIDYTIYFPYIIERLQKKNNINTIYDGEQGQLTIVSGNQTKENDFKIKLYLSISPTKIIPTLDALYNFISDNNIKQTSKIESRDRSDTIKIKVSSKEDALKLINFINNNESIKSVSRDTNPFLANVGVVGIGIENRISYNATTAYLISKYVESKRNSKDINNINASDFKNYIDRFFYNTFVSKATLNYFLEEEYVKKNLNRIKKLHSDEERAYERAVIELMHSINAIRVSMLDEDDLNAMLGVLVMANDKDFNEPQLQSIIEITDLDYSESVIRKKKEALEKYIKHSYNNSQNEETVIESVKKYYESLPKSKSRNNEKKQKYESGMDKKAVDIITNKDIDSFVKDTVETIIKEKSTRK